MCPPAFLGAGTAAGDFFPSIWKVLSHRRVQTWLSFQFWGKVTCKKGGKININRVNTSAAGKYVMRNKGLIKAK